MRSCLGLVLACLGLLGGLRATEPYTIAPPADWVKTVTPAQAGAPRETPSGQDFLLLDEQTNLTSEESYFRRVYQITSDAGLAEGSQLYFNFDPSYQHLVIHHARVIRDGQAADRLDPARIQVIQQERDLDRQLYNGQRSALLILEDIRIGDTVDLAFTIRGRNPVFAGRFIDTSALAWGVPVRDLRVRVFVPASRHIASRIHGSSPAVHATRPAGSLGQEFSWIAAQLPPVESENSVPASEVIYPFIEFSEFADWSAVVDWALPLYATPEKPSDLITRALADIRRETTQPEQQVLAALRLVQQDVRYLGIQMGPGSHRPSEPHEVLRRRFGDCKDKTRLLVTLLRQLGCEAWPALVHSSNRQFTAARLPSPYAFDHVIVAVDLPGQPRRLLDPTMTYQRGGTLEARHVGHYGPYLLIAPGQTQLATAPTGPGDAYRTRVSETFATANMDQPSELTVVTVAEGASANSVRAYFATRSRDQIGRDYLDYYTRYYAGIASAGPVEFGDDPVANRTTVTERYRIKDLFSPTTADNPVRRAEFQPAAIWDQMRIPNLGQRRFPYALSHPTTLEQEMLLKLPDDWSVEGSTTRVDDPAFSATVKVTPINPRTIRLNYTWQSAADAVPVARMPEFTANIKKAQAELGYQLTWNTALTEGAAGPYPLNWPMLALALAVLAGCGIGTWWLARRPNPTPPEPPLLLAPKPDDPYSLNRRATADVAGLSGWLILVGFGIVVRPFTVLAQIAESHRAYFHDGVWQALTTPGQPGYNANYLVSAPLELTVNFFLFGACIGLGVLFFRRSHLFPRSMQVFLGLQIPLGLIILWNNDRLGVTVEGNPDTLRLFIQSVIAAVIWIPYFQISRRVKATFVR